MGYTLNLDEKQVKFYKKSSKTMKLLLLIIIHYFSQNSTLPQ